MPRKMEASSSIDLLKNHGYVYQAFLHEFNMSKGTKANMTSTVTWFSLFIKTRIYLQNLKVLIDSTSNPMPEYMNADA
jgi:hypothetical protein